MVIRSGDGNNKEMNMVCNYVLVFLEFNILIFVIFLIIPVISYFFVLFLASLLDSPDSGSMNHPPQFKYSLFF